MGAANFIKEASIGKLHEKHGLRRVLKEEKEVIWGTGRGKLFQVEMWWTKDSENPIMFQQASSHAESEVLPGHSKSNQLCLCYLNTAFVCCAF